MIVSRFLLWARGAAPGDRAEAVSALGRAYLYSDLSPEDRQQAAIALTAMLDDTSPVVRRALAESLGSSPDAPRHIIVALSGDQIDVAELVLARSPVLADCDLVDSAAMGDERLQRAIASRPWLSSVVSAAIAEIGTAPALVTLARNEAAEIADFSLARMVERHGSHGPLREALLARPDLPIETAQSIAVALAGSLGSFATGCGWMSAERSERIVRDARERITITLSAGADVDNVSRLAAHLRRSGQLTPGLILRAILSRSLPLAEAALSELSGVPKRRVSATFRDGRGGAFRALFSRAGLPETLRPAFEAALTAYREAPSGEGAGGALSRRMIARALSACETLPPDEAGRLMALLHRFEAEAARDEARLVADGLADRAALAFVLTHAPEALEHMPATPKKRLAA